MRFEGGQFYHVYNRSYSKTPVFSLDKNYEFFLQKIKSLQEYCDIVAYCLMPDHFHLMIFVPINSTGLTRLTAPSGLTGLQLLSRKLGTILSSYTQAFNKLENRTGSLFQPKTKAKELNTQNSLICFHYIHQNPVKASLAMRLEDWTYSSFREYMQNENGICNKVVAYSLLEISKEKEIFVQQSYSVINFNIG